MVLLYLQSLQRLRRRTSATSPASSLAIAGPNIVITDRPGLGVEVDWDVVAAHASG